MEDLFQYSQISGKVGHGVEGPLEVGGAAIRQAQALRLEAPAFA